MGAQHCSSQSLSWHSSEPFWASLHPRCIHGGIEVSWGVKGPRCPWSRHLVHLRGTKGSPSMGRWLPEGACMKASPCDGCVALGCQLLAPVPKLLLRTGMGSCSRFSFPPDAQMDFLCWMSEPLSWFSTGLSWPHPSPAWGVPGLCFPQEVARAGRHPERGLLYLWAQRWGLCSRDSESLVIPNTLSPLCSLRWPCSAPAHHLCPKSTLSQHHCFSPPVSHSKTYEWQSQAPLSPPGSLKTSS